MSCKVERVERVYQKHGERFVRHLLLPEERAQLERTARPVRFLAMRFAAKEAIVKGMGTGFRMACGSAMSASCRTPGANRKWFIRSAAPRCATV